MKPAHNTARTRGGATVEFALVFIAVWSLVATCWVAGHIALQRSLIKDAARDAAAMVANASPSELATAGAVNDLEDRVEAKLTEAIQAGGNEVIEIDIDRQVSGAYAPALTSVRVQVDAAITDPIFDSLMYGQHPVTIAVEVPHGSRLSGP